MIQTTNHYDKSEFSWPLGKKNIKASHEVWIENGEVVHSYHCSDYIKANGEGEARGYKISPNGARNNVDDDSDYDGEPVEFSLTTEPNAAAA